MKTLTNKKLPLNLAAKVSGGDAKGCTYDGKKYSDGARIVLKDGSSQTCQNGSWTE